MTGPVDMRAAGIAHKANAMRERSRVAIDNALSAYQRAEAAFEDAKLALNDARTARDEAKRALNREMEGRGRVLIGNTLVSCNAHGGVHIEHVDIFGEVK
ncbi:MAG TPA: hypothetical protein VFM56_12710 [Solimonas sp.]|nr:hypothetical protein [Solimonas sp.]